MWEVYALAIVSELKTRTALAELTELELDVLYARAKTRLWDKIRFFNQPGLEGIRISDFGTRRRHSFLWQEYCVQAMRVSLNTGPTEDGRGAVLGDVQYCARVQTRSRSHRNQCA